MKLFLLFFGLVFLASCSGDNFNSVQRDDTQQQLSEDGDFPHNEEIRNLASEADIVKIGNKKHKSVNVGATVGQNSLRISRVNTDTKSNATSKTRVLVSLDSKNVVTQTSETQAAMTGTSAENELADVSILLYMDNRKDLCVQNLRKHTSIFLSGIKDYKWQVAFAYHTDPQEHFLHPLSLFQPLQLKLRVYDANSKLFKAEYIHILSSEHSYSLALELFDGTLYSYDATRRPSDDKSPPPVLGIERVKARDSNPDKVVNPLNGLNQILQTHLVNSRKKVVLFFGNNIPYYTDQEWDQFFQNNPDTSLFFISARTANLSNIETVLSSSDHDVNYVPGCDVHWYKPSVFGSRNEQYIEQYTEHLENLLGQITSRL